MFSPPHGKGLPVDYKVKGPFDDFQKNVDLLFDTFLENYNYYKAGKIPLSLEDEYEAFGLPGPSQYDAFSKLFSLFKNEEFELLKSKDFYYYDLTQENTQSERGIVEFIENLINFDFVDQDRKVIFSCGSFWEKDLEIREKILNLLELLHINKGVKIQLYTNCEEEKIKGHNEFISQIKGTSSFGLRKRIPIHFFQAGNDYFFIEFPHAEEIIVRLDLFLDIKKIKCRDDLEKTDVEQFFYGLIQQALV